MAAADVLRDQNTAVIIETDGSTVERLVVEGAQSEAVVFGVGAASGVPPDVRRLHAIAARPWPTRMLPGTPHAPEVLTAGLLRQDLFIALFRAIAEAKTAEHGARLSAMQAAEQNIEERLARLRNRYHQLRQALITEELLDVVSGFEARDKSY